MEALLVNPYDTAGMAQAIRRALAMPEAEQKERMRFLREIVAGHNVYGWAAEMLLDAAYLRKRSRIDQLVSGPSLENDLLAASFRAPPRA
jgi:trehalose 6-phosphate synthase